MGYMTSPGWRVSLEFDYINQNQLRSGTHSLSDAQVAAINDAGGSQEVEKQTINRYFTLGLNYTPSHEWNFNLQVPIVDRSHDTYGAASNPLTPDQIKARLRDGLLGSGADAKAIDTLLDALSYEGSITAATIGTKAFNLVEGTMLPADAQDEIDRASRSIWGLQLTCGPLCADVRQFPLNPSSILLRNQTAFLIIKSAETTLLPILDATTRAIAEGYTLPTGSAASKAKFAQAASLLQGYITAVQRVLASGYTKPETASLLINQATTLRTLVLAQSV